MCFKPLQQPYDGPFRVLDRADNSKATPALPRMTRSGQRVHFPDLLMGLIESFASSLEGE